MRLFYTLCVLVVRAAFWYEEDLIIEDEGFYQELRFWNHAWNSGITSHNPEDWPAILGQVDTGSCNTVVPLLVCFQNCTSPNKYSMLPPKDSWMYDRSYSLDQITAGLKPKTYLSAEFQTVQIADSLYLPNNDVGYDKIGVMIEGVVYSLTTYDFSAILGLCPQNEQNGQRTYYDEAKEGDPRLLQRNTLPYDIKDYNGNSFKNMFSIYLDPSDIHHKSTIVYGAIHHQFQLKPIVYFQNYQKAWYRYSTKAGEYPSDKWKVKVTKIRVGDTKIVDNSWFTWQSSPEIEFALFDTGCTFHKAPKEFIDKIIDLKGLKVVYEGETQITECTAKQYEELGPLHFHSQEEVITLAKLQWVKFSEKQQACAIMISPLPPAKWDGHFILGFNFFKQHYTVFDNENNQIGVYNLEDEKTKK